MVENADVEMPPRDEPDFGKYDVKTLQQILQKLKRTDHTFLSKIPGR